MSELINNQRKRIDDLKILLKKLHSNDDVDSVKREIEQIFATVAHEDVIAAEQELIAEGTPIEKMLELCDLHGMALHGLVNPSLNKVPAGHPADILHKENMALRREIELIALQIKSIREIDGNGNAGTQMFEIHKHFNNLMDIEKHYSVKENALFPFLEKYQITGPSTVMWGKDDEVRKKLKDCQTVLTGAHGATKSVALQIIESLIEPALDSVEDMIKKEEDILIPMCLDTFNEFDWHEIYKSGKSIGYTIIDPREEWEPAGYSDESKESTPAGRIQLPSGNFSPEELLGIFSTLPVDLTFVDKDDTVRFFTEGAERIFQRSRAIIGRKVQYCHPPHSVAVVEQILSDFKSGKQNKADFWIQLHGKFVYISYFAIRSPNGEYLGTLEVSQDLTYYRGLEGEKRILSYQTPTDAAADKVDKGILPGQSKPNEAAKKEEVLTVTYDARADLANGVHPAEKVLTELAAMPEGGRYTLITPFPPMPLIMKAEAIGFSNEQKQISSTEFHTIFFK